MTRVSRESRLLLLTVAICAIVLVLMARLRFPHSPAVVDAPAPALLERLAARASYDALARSIEQVEPMIAPNLIVLRVAAPGSAAPRGIREAIATAAESSSVHHVAALRIGPETAVAALDPGTRIDGIVGGTESGTAAIRAVDPIRRIARVRVPAAPARQLPQLPLTSLATPAYIVAVEGTQAGVTLRPVFLGSGSRFSSRRWSRPLLPLGGVAVAPGALLFSLSGDFIGTVVIDDGAPAIAGARDVLDAAERLAEGAPAAPADLGIAVQALTSGLVKVLGVQQGVVVSEVGAGSAADGELHTGDVITSVDGWSTDNPDELLIRLAAHRAGEAVTIAVVRDGTPRTIRLTVRDANTSTPAPAAGSYSFERGAGTRVDRSPRALDSVLKAGDLITRAGSIDAPTPRQLRSVLAQPSASGFAALVLRRDGRQRVVAVPTGGAVDAALR